MAAKKVGSKAKAAGLWLGAFSLLETGKGEASFQLVGHARDAEDAAKVFEARLLHLRESTTLFEKESSVYLDALIDLSPSTFPVPTLVNYVARQDSPQSDMWAPVPEQPDSRAEIYGWGEDYENEKTIEREAFLEFARKKSAAKAKAKKPAPKSAPAAAKPKPKKRAK